MTTTDELEADVSLSTVHKSKGLEWDFVQICEDFMYDPLSPESLEDEGREEELALLYVAATRAILMLAINSNIIALMQDYVRREKTPLTANRLTEPGALHSSQAKKWHPNGCHILSVTITTCVAAASGTQYRVRNDRSTLCTVRHFPW